MNYDFKNNTVHRSLNGNPVNGILSCGFLVKTASRSDRDICFTNYGAFLLLNGSGKYVDQNGKATPLHPGAFVQRMPGVRHSTFVDQQSGWVEFFVCMGRDFYEAMAELGLFSRKPVLFPGIDQDRMKQCSFLMKQFRNLPDQKLPFLFTEVQQFILSLTEADKIHRLGMIQEDLLRAADFLCAADFPNPKETALRIGMEYDTFRKKFRTVFDCAPGAYQMRYRLNYAKQLLLDSEKSIGQISEICKFSDAFAFSKAFHKHFGASPREFRNANL